jgi:hypothetical protein
VLALLGLYSAALYADKIYGVLVANVVQTAAGLFIVRVLDGVSIKNTFAAASDQLLFAKYVLGLIVASGYNMDTIPEPVSAIVPKL